MAILVLVSYGNLDFIVSQTKIPKDLIRKAATLLFGILTSHPFVDGNKRTALESMKTFLYLNNKNFVTTEEDIWNVLHQASEEKLKFEEIVNWVKKNTKW